MQNDGASRAKTVLEKSFHRKTGPYFIKITDDDGRDADAQTPYQVQITTVEDIDPNEPNDKPAQATEIGELECSEWGEWVSFQGTYGTSGDVDWFKLPLKNCKRGIIEAELTIDTTTLEKVANKIQSSISLVPPSECAADEDCRN